MGKWVAAETDRLRAAAEKYDLEKAFASGCPESLAQCLRSIAEVIGGDRDEKQCLAKRKSLTKVKHIFTPANDVDIQRRVDLGQFPTEIDKECFPEATSKDVWNRIRSPKFTGRSSAEDGSGGGGSGLVPHTDEEKAALKGDANAGPARADARLFVGAGAEGWRAFPRTGYGKGLHKLRVRVA